MMASARSGSPTPGQVSPALSGQTVGALHRGWLGASLGAGGLLARAAGICMDEMLGVGADLAHTMERTAEEVQAAFDTSDEAGHPAALVVRTGDLDRLPVGGGRAQGPGAAHASDAIHLG
jgi:hypothetical protein